MKNKGVLETMAFSDDGELGEDAENAGFSAENTAILKKDDRNERAKNDIYSMENVEPMLDNDELSQEEAAFMRGYEVHN